MFIEFRGKRPKIAATAFVAPTAVLIGDVEVGEQSSIWFGVVIRGDNGPIRIGARTSIQDNSVVHVSPGATTVVGDDCTVGHSVTMEDCVIEHGALIGSNAVVLNGAVVGSKALIAAGSVVPGNARVPAETLNAGAPAVVKRKLFGESLGWVENTPASYVRLSRTYLEHGIGAGQTLDGLLAAGDIDALVGALKPASYRKEGPVVRLFPNYREIERDGFLATGIHPIMHALVIRRELYEREPWLATSIYNACEAAKRAALAQMHFTAALRYMLPWLIDHLEEQDAVFGPDPWPYGVSANRPTLEAFARHLVADGFLIAPPPLDQVFVPV